MHGILTRGLKLSVALTAALTGPAMADESATSGPSSAPPAGQYQLDRSFSRVQFSVSHLGFSEFTRSFRSVSAGLSYDPTAPESMELLAEIDPLSVETLIPELNVLISGASFLDAGAHPDIRFASTAIRLTGPQEAAVRGDLTLLGITRPITLHVRYNGGYAGTPEDPGGARIGFSAEGAFFRSDFGMTAGLPVPGAPLGMGDLVGLRIEAEFTNPDASGVQVGP